MDTYVRELGTIQDHDQFYVNETLIDAFKNYTTQIVSRYVNSPVLLSWYVSMKSSPHLRSNESAGKSQTIPSVYSPEAFSETNALVRCNSTLATSPSCSTTTVTKWHSIIAQHIKSVDPNHLVSSG